MKVKDLSVIFGVIFIVVMLVIPLPPGMLSFLIMINMS